MCSCWSRFGRIRRAVGIVSRFWSICTDQWGIIGSRVCCKGSNC